MRISPILGLAVALATLAASGSAGAAPTAYTSAIPFLAALPGPARTLDFDALPSGAVIAPGSAIGGVVFGHALDGVDLIATPGTLDGNGVGFATTSAPHFLGTSDRDVLLDGDDLALGFAAANAVGLFVVSAEAPGVSLFDGDIRLAAGGASAALDVDAVQATLPDGSRVFFLGLIDPGATFAAANVGTFGAGGEFAFNLDDVVTALPEPAGAASLAWGLLVLASARRRPIPEEERR